MNALKKFVLAKHFVERLKMITLYLSLFFFCDAPIEINIIKFLHGIWKIKNGINICMKAAMFCAWRV